MKNSELATRYSEACTRAAVAALIASALSFSFAQRLSKFDALQAFAEYVNGREQLDTSLQDLTTSDFWSAITVALDRDASTSDTITVDELASVECVISSGRSPFARVKAGAAETGRTSWLRDAAPISAANAHPATHPRKPVRPQASQLTLEPEPPAAPIPPEEFVYPCSGLDVLETAVKTLWDEPKIALARSFSNESNAELYRWQINRNRVSQPVTIVNSIAQIPPLDIRRLKELNALPRTTVAEFSAVARERTLVTGPYSSDQQSIGVAALSAEVAIFVFVTYFLLNYRAAALANVLKEPGSLFSTLWASTLGQGFYLFLLLIPATAAMQLALRMSAIGGKMLIAVAAVTAFLTAYLAFSFGKQFGLLELLATLRESLRRRGGIRRGRANR